MQNMDKAIAALLEALEFTPNNVRLRKQIAELMLQAGQLDGAIGQLKVIIEQTEDPEYMLLLGKTYYQRGDFQDAETALSQVVATAPSAEAYLLLSKARFALAKYREAGDDYQKALDRDESLADAGYQDQLSEHGIRVRGKARTDSAGGIQDGESAIYGDDIVERPALTFKDVGGLDELKEDIRMNIIYPFHRRIGRARREPPADAFSP